MKLSETEKKVLAETIALLKFRPLHDYVLVKRVERDKVSKGGIHIPDTSPDTKNEAHVLAVGPGRALDAEGNRRPMNVKVGDRVLLARFGGAGKDVKHPDFGEGKLVIREGEIAAILESAETPTAAASAAEVTP